MELAFWRQHSNSNAKLFSLLKSIFVSRGHEENTGLTYQLLNLVALSRWERIYLLLRQTQNLHQHLL